MLLSDELLGISDRKFEQWMAWFHVVALLVMSLNIWNDTLSLSGKFVIAAASSCSTDWCCWFNQRQWIDAWAAKLLSWLLTLSFVNYVQSSLRWCNYRSGSLMFQNLRNINGNCCGLLKWGVFDSPSCSIKSFFFRLHSQHVITEKLIVLIIFTVCNQKMIWNMLDGLCWCCLEMEIFPSESCCAV